MEVWECSNNSCKKKNHYSEAVHRNGEVLIQMKVLGPKKVSVKCRYCGKKQTIEVYD